MTDENRRFIKNSVASLLQQMVTICCGLVLSRFILHAFGSSVNGMIVSVNQFISMIAIIEGGMGVVARVALYKPLAEKNQVQISVAYKTIALFFRKLSLLFLGYLILLCIFYPFVAEKVYSYFSTSILIFILGLSSIFEYFFGITSQMLLLADQKGYVYSIIQITFYIIRAVLAIALIKTGSSIHIVKFVSALVYVIRPILLYKYVRKKYQIDMYVSKDDTLLFQRKAALVRHIAFYIHTSTDVIVITLYLNLAWVSVYSTYQYVIHSLSILIAAVLNNMEAVFGELFAKNEVDKITSLVKAYDLLSKIFSGSCFFTCMIVITYFVEIYTESVSDIEYNHPVFAIILCLAEMIYCMGLTYQNIYLAAGHIKQTQWMAVFEALLNIALSMILIKKYEIIGVAIGTLVAMIFKNIVEIYYVKSKLADISIPFLIKSYLGNIVAGSIFLLFFKSFICIQIDNFVKLFVFAILVFGISIVYFTLVNFLIAGKDIHILLYKNCLKMKDKFFINKYKCD